MKTSVLDPALSVTLESLARLLRNLVSWAKHPQADPLTDAWAGKTIDEIRRVADIAIRTTDDPRLTERLRIARNLAHDFVGAMTNNPSLSTVRYNRWESAVDRQIVLDLVALQGEFAALAKLMETEPIPDDDNGSASVDLSGADAIALDWLRSQFMAGRFQIRFSALHQVLRDAGVGFEIIAAMPRRLVHAGLIDPLAGDANAARQNCSGEYKILAAVAPMRLPEPAASERAAGMSETEAIPSAVAILIGWPSICTALGKKHPQDQSDIESLNKRYRGPIITAQGGKPRVSKGKLIPWWNSLADQYEEQSDRAETERIERTANLGDVATADYGRDGAVIPELNAGIRRRRGSK